MYQTTEMASLSRRLERFLFILMALTAHLPAVLPTNHCPSNFNITYDTEVIIPKGGQACLYCDYPSSRIRPEWYRGTSVISDGNTMDPCDCTVSNRQLCFENITGMAVGNDYSCQVQIGIGQVDTCPFSVVLAAAPNITSAPGTVEIALNPNSPIDVDRTISIGISPGKPPATVQWTKNGEIISRETNLTIFSVSAEDRGVYTVNVSNTVGFAVRNISVSVHFLNVVVTQLNSVGDGTYKFRCMISGYPELNFVRWSTTNSPGVALSTHTGSTTHGPFESNITNTLTVTQSDCADAGGYTCFASIQGGTVVRDSSQTADCPAVTQIRVTPLSTTSVQVDWDSPSMPWDVFVIMYRLESSNGPFTEVEVQNNQVSVIIDQLTPGETYEFRGRIDRNNDGDPVIITLSTTCTEDPVTSVATTVSAQTNVVENKRIISVSWDAIMQGSSAIASYRLYIHGSGGTITSVIVNTTNYVLPSEQYSCTNNQVYTFIVQGLNPCNEGGPNSSSVDVTCLAVERLASISSVTTYSTAINVQWTTANGRVPKIPLNLTALQIKVIDGEQYKLNYTTNSVITGAFCMGELEKNTLYEVCLHPVFIIGDDRVSESVCMFAMTRNVDSDNVNDILEQCPGPVKRTTQVSIPSSSTTTTFPDYAIAVIVVGVLGIIALIFCFIGLCFACHSSKQKEIDFGSTSSLQAPSEAMHKHHRPMSPSRSCLSYHTKGHSTNWSDHVDTLRQMETDTGTHV